jgi:hypothetical protein
MFFFIRLLSQSARQFLECVNIASGIAGFSCRQKINQYASLIIQEDSSHNFASLGHCSGLCLLWRLDVMPFHAVLLGFGV